MASSSSKLVIYAAIAGDAGVAISKFIAASITGSSAMFSEAIHSSIDTCNSLLLLLGVYRSRRPPDELHPFGHGRELYFWSLIVAILIFGVGGGLSVYEGILHLMHPVALEDPVWNYVVLGIAAVFGAGSWWIGFREFVREKRSEQGLWHTFRTSKDPIIFTVVFEDTAALLGVLVAFLGVWAGHQFNNVYCDGAASVLIGVILAVVAGFLAYESQGLLIGESANVQAVAGMRRVAAADPAVERVGSPLTMQLAPHQILLILQVKFVPGLSVPELEAAIDRLETNIRFAHPDVTRISIEAEAFKTALP